MAVHTSGCVCEGKCRDVQIKAFKWKVGDGAIKETTVNWRVLGSSILPEPLWCPSFLCSLSTMKGAPLFPYMPLHAPATFMSCPVTWGPANMDCILQHHELPNSFLLQVVCVGYFVSTTRTVANTSVRTSSLLSSKNPCHWNFMKP